MLIDWFTVVAQIVNFLVLAALLRHFLWGRLVRAIDEREARVAGKIAEAEEKSQEAGRQMEETRAQALELEHKREEMIVLARKDADHERNKLVQQARDSVRDLEARWREDLDHEKAAFFLELRQRTTTEILALLRRALKDLASHEVQDAAMQVFLEKLRSLDVPVLQELSAGELVVRSAVVLPWETQEEIQAILSQRLGQPPHLLFERASDMGWGIELRGGGRKIGWSPDSYLDSMEENLKEALDRRPDDRRPEAADRAMVS